MTRTGMIFKALADPTRREILRRLKDGEAAAGEIAAQFETAAASVSRHLAILAAAELIAARREGNRIYYRLVPHRLARCLGDFLNSVCPARDPRPTGRRKGP